MGVVDAAQAEAGRVRLPRNCAEATCKDIGVVCADSGYTIVIGGAAGMEVRETEHLASTPSEDEAVAIILAVTQLYRENARYLDRIWKWMGKVGLDWIRAQIDDPAAAPP